MDATPHYRAAAHRTLAEVEGASVRSVVNLLSHLDDDQPKVEGCSPRS